MGAFAGISIDRQCDRSLLHHPLEIAFKGDEIRLIHFSHRKTVAGIIPQVLGWHAVSPIISSFVLSFAKLRHYFLAEQFQLSKNVFMRHTGKITGGQMR